MRIWVLNIQKRGNGYIEKQAICGGILPTQKWICAESGISATDAEAIVKVLSQLLNNEQPHAAIVTDRLYSVQGLML